MHESWSYFLANLIGAVAGSGISVSFMMPVSPRDAVIRFSTGVFVGLVFGESLANVYEKYGGIAIGSSGQRAIAGGFLAAFIAWWILGAVVRFLKRVRGPRDFHGSGGP